MKTHKKSVSASICSAFFPMVAQGPRTNTYFNFVVADLHIGYTCAKTNTMQITNTVFDADDDYVYVGMVLYRI